MNEEAEPFEIIKDCGDYHLINTETGEELGYDLRSPTMCKENWINVCNSLNELTHRCEGLKAALRNFYEVELCEICEHSYCLAIMPCPCEVNDVRCRKGHKCGDQRYEEVFECADFKLDNDLRIVMEWDVEE